MRTPKLPDHLELLLTDEPVLDVYSFGPWRVPDGLYEEIGARAEALNRDPRASELDGELPTFYRDETTATGADLWCLLEYLLGPSALRAGPRRDVQTETMASFLGPPLSMMHDLVVWSVWGGAMRPPGEWLPQAAGDDPERRRLSLELTRATLDVFADLEPVAARIRATRALYDRWEADLGAGGSTTAAPWYELTTLCAEAADDDILAVLPELHGPVGYLEWACSGLAAAHARLLDATGHGDPFPMALAKVLLQCDLRQVPGAFEVALTLEDCETTQVHAFELGDDFSLDKWRAGLRGWLMHGMVVGEVDACRAWLDMATRVSGAARGLPGNPVSHVSFLPVGLFQHDLRQLFRPRSRIVNPLATSLGQRHQDDDVDEELDDRLVGQPELTSVLREAGATASTALRLLIAGPEATGRHTAVDLLTRALANRGLANGSRWLSDRLFTNLNSTDAVRELRATVVECVRGGYLLVVDGLDRLLANDRCGTAVAEELRHALRLHTDLSAVAVCRPDGDLQVFEASPALFDRFTVARTYDFTEDHLSELVQRAIARRGAQVTDDVAAAAGALLAGTAAHRNLRGVRLVDHLVTLAVTVAEARDARDATDASDGASVRVTLADLPTRLFPVGAAGSDPHADLDDCVGIESVKTEIRLLVSEAKAAMLRRDAGMAASGVPRHLAFTGESGTGKTMVARILGRMLADLGLLSSGHLVSVDRSDLVGDGGARVGRWLERAAGGVLCIEDAHDLTPIGDDAWRNRAALGALVAGLEAQPRDLVVVVTGPEAGVNGLLQTDAELSGRFTNKVRFPTLADTEVVDLFAARAAGAGFTLQDGVTDTVRALLQAQVGRTAGRASLALDLLDRTIAAQARRILADGVVDEDESLHELLVGDVPEELTASSAVELSSDPLTEIDHLVGLDTVKREIHLLVAEAKAERLRRDAGLPVTAPTRHLVFTGNPGTAKTTVARLLAAVYAKLGLLRSGHLVEVSPSDLIAEYLGQTAPKVRAAVGRALGGVLFVDEAYALTPPKSYDDYGDEAVAELLKQMEEHRDDLVVIVAGYSGPMTAFVGANPGLESRFPNTVRFPDYSDDELVAIFELMASEAGYELGGGATDVVRALLKAAPRDESFGNGRVMRNVLDRAIAVQAQRITALAAPGGDDVRTLLADDVRAVATTDQQPADLSVGQYL
ncbi:MAG TPA: AAA family ATPase [Acidimicrobiales bacterium]|nr:AAA family ATPase [Acidimicrobiales bacterium]